MTETPSHLKYAESIEESIKPIASIQGAVLKYKDKIDATGNVLNSISNSFFNINDNWTEKTENEFKDMHILTKKDITARINNTKKVKNQIYKIIWDIQQDTTILPVLKDLLLRKTERLLKNIEIIELSTPIEAEKYGYTIHLSEKWIDIEQNTNTLQQLWLSPASNHQHTIKEIERLQTIVYWPKVSDVPEERNTVVSILNDLFQKQKEKLSPYEFEVFQHFLHTFKDSIVPINLNKIEKIEMPWQIPIQSIKNITDYMIQKFFDIPDRWSSVKTGQNNLWVSFQHQELKLPSNKAFLWESSLATISEHEIGWHVIRGAKSKQRLWFASDNYENIEEWMNKLNEYFLYYDTLEDIPVQPEIWHISTFIWENYDFKNTFELLKIYFKLSWKNNEEAWKLALWRTKRVKWYYARNETGANRKDVIYYRGIQKLINYLKPLQPQERADFYHDTYFSKLSFEDIDFVPELRKQLNISSETTDIPYPLYKLISKKEKFVHPKTGTHKGAFLGQQNIKENLIAGDFRFLKLEPLNREKKKEILHIMQYKEESKEYDNLRKDLKQINTLLRWWNEINTPENLFISPITKKLFIKRKHMEEREITDQKTLHLENRSRWIFSTHQIFQKLGDEIEWILTRKLQ